MSAITSGTTGKAWGRGMPKISSLLLGTGGAALAAHKVPFISQKGCGLKPHKVFSGKEQKEISKTGCDLKPNEEC